MNHRRPARTRRRSLFSWRELVLTMGALAGSLCILAATAGALFDVTPLVFRSGSMSPEIHTGALALARTVPAEELEVGDIVSVRTGSGVRVTHRIEAVEVENGQATLVLKGDANAVPDAEQYTVDSAERVLFDIPKAGFVLARLSSPIGTVSGSLLVALVLLVAFAPGSSYRCADRPNPRPRRAAPTGRRVRGDEAAIRQDGPTVGRRSLRKHPSPGTRRSSKYPRPGTRRSSKHPRPGTRRSSKHPPVLIGAVVLVAGGSGAGLPAPVATLASWADTASATSGTMDAHTLVPPAPVNCEVVSTGLSTSGLRYSWTGVDRRYTYQVERIDSGGVVRQTDKIADSGVAGATYSVTYDGRDLPNGAFTVRVTTFLSGTPVWVSSGSTTQKGSKSTSLLLVVTLSC